VQVICSGDIMISNPTADIITLSKVTSEYLGPDGATWLPFDNGDRNATVEGNILSGGGAITTSFYPGRKGRLSVRSQQRVAGSPPYTSKGAFDHRLHHSFGPAIKVRLTFVDSSQQTKVLSYMYVQEPLPARPASYADAVAAGEIQADGFGPKFVCPMWLTVDNPVTLEHFLIFATSEKESPQNYYLHCAAPLSNSLNTDKISPSLLKAKAFKAALRGESEIDLGSYGDECVLKGVVDLETKNLIGMRAAITTKSGSSTATASQCLLIDWAKFATNKPPEPTFQPKQAPTWSW